MNVTTVKLLNQFVYQNRIFVHNPREISTAKELATLELFKIEAGMCVGVPGYWLTLNRKITVVI